MATKGTGLPGSADAFEGDTESQFPPELVVAAEVKESVPPPLFDTLIVWLRAMPCWGNGNDRLVVSIESVGGRAAVTVKVTETKL